jgi:hypothetical protein
MLFPLCCNGLVLQFEKAIVFIKLQCFPLEALVIISGGIIFYLETYNLDVAVAEIA